MNNISQNSSNIEFPNNFNNLIKVTKNKNLVVVLVALYRYQNFPIRMLHQVLEKIDGITPYTIFFKDVKTNIFAHPTKKEEDLFAKKISELKPDLIGFSLYTIHFPIAKLLTNIIRKVSSAPILWGGLHPTIKPDESIKEADMICVGEGEGALTDLVKRMRDGKNYDNIPNIWINKNEKIIKNHGRNLIQDLDSLPYPSYGNKKYFFINSNKLDQEDLSIYDPLLWVYGSRGCPFVCTFCINSLTRPLFKDQGKYRRKRSVENIVGEMQEQLKLPGSNKKEVLFMDEVFGNDKEWMYDFEKIYPKKIGLPYLFSTLAHPNLINNETLDHMSKSGAQLVRFGIQTGSDKIRNDLFKRPTKNNYIVKISNEIVKRGIQIKYDLIGDNPYDTEDTLRETVDLLYKLPQPLDFHYFSLQYFPGYPLTKKALADGKIKPEDATVEALFRDVSTDWEFLPKLTTDWKKKVQNIIWLIVSDHHVWFHTNEKWIKYAVKDNSFGSLFVLNYLNLKAVFWGKIIGVGSFRTKHPEMYVWFYRFGRSLEYLFSGQIKKLFSKFIEIVKKNYSEKQNNIKKQPNPLPTQHWD